MATMPPAPEAATASNDDYYETVVALPTTDISEPLHRVKPEKLSSTKAALEYLGIAIKTGFVLYLGLRLDYLFIPGYLRNHAFYYITWVALIIAGETVLNYLLDWKHLLGTDWFKGTMVFLATGTFYYGGLPFWFLVVKEPLSRRVGKAKFIMISELLFSVMWLVAGAGLRAFCQTVDTIPFPESIPEVASTSAGLVIVVTGYIFKGWACILTGFNSYFWRDMLTDIPNSHFVESSLYSVFSHPTYTVGYIQALGAAIFYRSVEGCIAYVGMQTCILLFVYFVEQPFIVRTYKQTMTGPSSVEQTNEK